MNATDRYKMLLATAFERVCVLEENLEIAQQRIEELEAGLQNPQLQNGEVIQDGDRHEDPVR